MKIVAIADTHGKHGEVQLLEGDVLIHAGDFTAIGAPHELIEFVDWFAIQPFEHKIAIAGNHDACAEVHPEHTKEEFDKYGILYLQDEWTEIEGVKFYGSPWTPTFQHWHFMAGPDAITEKWAKIPDDTDVLITHGPPSGFLDVTMEGRHEGCPRLRKEVLERVRPELHVFGHIHEAYGIEQASAFRERTQTVFVNASMLNRDYELTNAPVVVSVRRP